MTAELHLVPEPETDIFGTATDALPSVNGGIIDDFADESLIEPTKVFITSTEPAATGTGSKPILPSVTVDAVKATAIQAARAVAYHLVRLPWYYLRVAGRSPIGLRRVAAPVWRWVSDAGTAASRESLRAAAAESQQPGAAQRAYDADARHSDRLRFRGLLAAVCALVAVFLVWRWTTQATTFGRATVTVALPLMFGVVGRDRSKPIITRAVFTGRRPTRPDPTIVTKALAACGISALSSAIKADPERAIRFTGPAQRSGKGWRIEMDLPPGVTAGDVIERRSNLASALRRPLGCVWPEGDETQHEARLILYVADTPMSGGGPLRWSLADRGAVNLFEPVPIGTDTRQRPVEPTLMFASGIIGAVPRMGKSFFLRLLMLAMALDVRCRLYVYNLKGGADFNSARHVAHSYRSGDSPEDLAVALADMQALQAEMRRRSNLLERLALEEPELCPEGKLTDELASAPQLGLYPIGVFVDECQLWFESDMKAEFEAVVTDLVKRGPAMAIMVMLATQRVDKASIPTGISANAVLRFCLKVMGQVENDMVLGTSMYKAGFRATAFSRKDLGVGYLVGEGADPVITKTALVDGAEAETIALRARAARQAAGRLTGLAAGDEAVEVDHDTTTVVDHLAAVWPGDTIKVSHEELSYLLRDMSPELYGTWTAANVSRAATSHGLAIARNCTYSTAGEKPKRGLSGLPRKAVFDWISDRDAATANSAAAEIAAK